MIKQWIKKHLLELLLVDKEVQELISELETKDKKSEAKT